jgi:hypothetical protein
MCGIVGIADYTKSAIGAAEYNVFQQLLIADSARGMDGTGIMKVTEKGTISRVRKPGGPFGLLSDEVFQKKFLEPITKHEFVRWMVGHNRYATTGDKTVGSTHPFMDTHITLVHNGTATNFDKEKHKDKFKVDSQWLCHLIATEGIEKALDTMSGPFSIVFYDSKQKTMNFIRNYGRPMYMGINKNRNALLFGSEKKLLEWVADRNNFSNFVFNATEENVLYTFNLEKISPEETKIKTYYSTYSESGYGGYGSYDNSYSWDRYPEKPKTYTYENGKILQFTPKESPFRPTQTDPPKKERYISLSSYSTFHKAEKVRFNIDDYKEVKVNTKFTVMGASIDKPQYEEVDIRANISEAFLKECLEAQDKVLEGTIIAIVKNQEEKVKGFSKIIVWVNDVKLVDGPLYPDGSKTALAEAGMTQMMH